MCPNAVYDMVIQADTTQADQSYPARREGFGLQSIITEDFPWGGGSFSLVISRVQQVPGRQIQKHASSGESGAILVWTRVKRFKQGNGTSKMKYESAVENSATRTLVTGDSGAGQSETVSVPLTKRLMDLLVAIPALFILSPAMLLIWLAIKLADGGPVFFVQERRGLGGDYFLCMKFRTMRTDADRVLAHILATDPVMRAEWEATQKFAQDPRVTLVGSFLRRTSLDELPQLLNIIRGEMSIVGPRPIVPSEVQRYAEKIVFYDRVLPGVTGLWQINGRSDTTYAERIGFDITYVLERSLLKDIHILLATIPAVLFGRGAR